MSAPAALLDQVTEELYARHTADAEGTAAARREYEERRGKVHPDDELWEAWSAAFVEWYVVERVAPGQDIPPAATSYRALPTEDDKRAAIRALVTSQRSLFEVRSINKGDIELLDLLGGAVFHVAEQRALHGVELGDVAELRLVGIGGEVRFGRTFIYHPKSARGAIVERARDAGAGRLAARRDRSDRVAPRAADPVPPHAPEPGLRARLQARVKLALVVVLGFGLVLGSRASADTPADAPASLELDREAPPPGRSEFGFDAGAPVPGLAASVSLGIVDTPLLLRTADGESRPVHRRETLGLGAAAALGTSVVFDARLPLSRQTGDRLMALGDGRALDRWVPGDLRLGGRLRVVSTSHADALLRAELTLPTGDDLDFAGDPSWTVAWSLIGRFRLPAGIVVAGAGGIRLRGKEVIVADRLIGDELHGAIGIAVPIPPIHPLWCVADQVRITGELAGVLGDEVGGKTGPSPAEARIGVVTRPREWLDLGVRVGTGLGDQIGSPAWRATVELTFRLNHQLLPTEDPSPEPVEDFE